MIKLFYAALTLLLCLNLNLAVGQQFSPDVDKQLTSRGELYFSFQIDKMADLEMLTKMISIDRIEKDKVVFAYANKLEFSRFLQSGFSYRVESPPGIKKTDPRMFEPDDLRYAASWDYFPTYESYVSMMYQFESDYPDICRIHKIGESVNGRDLLYAEISDSVAVREAEPRFNYTSTMHGDETTGFVLMLRLIDYLCSNYGTDSLVTGLVNSTEIWINPNANPDGTYYSGNNTVNGAIRYNSNNVDLNRNFKDFLAGNHPDGYDWQDETIAMMEFADSIHFVMGANIHGGAEVLNYPWDGQSILHADDNWWVDVSRNYVDTVHTYSPSGYLDDLNNGITNGYAWYMTTGSRQDFMNYFHRSRELTLEISSIKNPPSTTLPLYWEYNYRSLLKFIENAGYGIRGIITDSLSGQPMVANVFIANHDAYNTDVFSEMPHGDYYRPIEAGSYDLTFSAPGYEDKTLSNIVVQSNQASYLDVQLMLKEPVAEFYASTTSSCDGEIQFVNESVTSLGSTYFWDFGDGNTSSVESPIHEYMEDGLYTVILKVSNPLGIDEYIRTSYIEIDRLDVPLTTNDSLCGAGIATLNVMSSYDIDWFNELSASQPFYSGSSYTTPYLDSSASYFVQSVMEPPLQSAGKPVISSGGDYYMNSNIHYLVFDCEVPLTIDSVKVYALFTSNRTIQLRDNAGQVIDETQVNIPAGESYVYLGFDVEVGTAYQLAGPANPGLYRDASGTNYPYNIQNVISITHSSASSNPTAYYYYFYDWKIRQKSCSSPKIEIHAMIYHDAPQVGFSYYFNSGSVYFINESIEGAYYEWNFGDGNSSIDVDPVHYYSSAGMYNVVLKAFNTCGADEYGKTIGVLHIQQNKLNGRIQIYPNPVSEFLHIKYEEMQPGDRIRIYSVNGSEIIKKEISVIEAVSIDVSSWLNGVYFLQYMTNNEWITEKIIIL